ncbi:MAG TPA: multidrug ABC transporter ATP-binding protein, partial [Algoriphagus sp.]|nr:multidrug ABC transporter ATP-binding protein [Algoriphagus sp.]
LQVLKDLSFYVNPGEKIALAGHSGAGKSTIIQLLLKFYEVHQGEIKIDGQNLNRWNLEQLRSHIGMVPQEVLLFGGSIRENIAYAKPNASEEEIIMAAKKANAWQFISQFPEGLDTLVGERGVKLSGGQRQRVAIARAILKDPSILILDEATSSLDAESEHLVQEALDELMKGRTTIIIAHRLATIRKVDRIYVLSEGKIVEQGNHLQLLEQEDGFYANLVRLQFAEN